MPIDGEGGRVELDELDVGHRHPRAQRHGDPVGGGLGRVGGHREQLAGATAGEQGVRGPHDVRTTGPGHPHAHAATALDHQVEHEGALVDADGGAVHGLDQRPLDLDPGGHAAGVHDAGEVVPALAGQVEVAVGVAVEHGPETDQLAHRDRALLDEGAHGIDVAEPAARGHGVGHVEVGAVDAGGEHGGDAALGPAGGGRVDGSPW